MSQFLYVQLNHYNVIISHLPHRILLVAKYNTVQNRFGDAQTGYHLQCDQRHLHKVRKKIMPLNWMVKVLFIVTVFQCFGVAYVIGHIWQKKFNDSYLILSICANTRAATSYLYPKMLEIF